MRENVLIVPIISPMIIEWLGFTVKPQLRDKFVTQDHKIWTPILANVAGFVGKEVWFDPVRRDRVYIVVRWQSREQWQAIPPSLLQETEEKFALAVGAENYQMIESREYQL